MTYYVTVEWVDPYGNFTRERVTINEAVLNLLRFARSHPSSVCTIELREAGPEIANLISRDSQTRRL